MKGSSWWATVVVGLLALGSPFAAWAAECQFPDNTDWVIDQSCEISTLRIAPLDVSVVDGAVLTVEDTGRLIFDGRNHRLLVDAQSRVVVVPGGWIRSNQVGPLLVRATDGGTLGYFLKQVDGPVLQSLNSDLGFHPSSTIKALYLLQALRQVDRGTLSLNTPMTLCPTSITGTGGAPTCNNGLGTSCPLPVSAAAAGGTGGNCTLQPNSAANCGATTPPLTQTLSLGVGLCAMMKVSNNPASNAVQETVGGGDPATGWNNMLSDAGAAVGLTSTSFGNRMGCGGPNATLLPAPFDQPNRTTLRDLGRLFEGMASDPSVLFPSAPPATFDFEDTDAYDLMDNHCNDFFVGAVINEQADEAGLSAAQRALFRGAVRVVNKDGNNGTTFVTNAGWISLPINGGVDRREYVFGVFLNNTTANSLGTNLRPVAAELLRPVIRDALEAF